MPVARIGLLGSHEFFSSTLQMLLKESGFDVELIDPASVEMRDSSAFDAYDLLVIDMALAEGHEEEFFSFVLLLKAFLLVDSKEDFLDHTAESSCYIDRRMSAEDIIAKVNSIIYRNSDVRRSPRLNVNMDVTYEYQCGHYKSSIQNLSLKGAFISTLNPLPMNSLVRLSFELGQGGPAIKALGRILYRIGYDLDKGIISHPASSDKKIIALPGMGIFFEDISAEDREAINSFIRENLF